MHAWRTWPVERLSPGFRKLLSMVTAAPHSQCGLCQIVMANSLAPRPLKHTHCMRNESWLQLRQPAATAGGLPTQPQSQQQDQQQQGQQQQQQQRRASAWGPGSDDWLLTPLPFLRS